MKRASLLLLTFACLVGCGSDKDARRAEGGPQYGMKRRPTRTVPTANPNDGMKVENELGVLETADVDAKLEEHLDEVKGCYQRAGKAQRYAEGKVLLRFLVQGDGRVNDVWVVESTLGNYDVERCLVEVGRRVVFFAPTGRKATTFDYPVEFHSTSQVTVLDIEGPKIEHDVASFLPQLAACGQVAVEGAIAIMYIEPSGFPGSVGLAAGTALDEDVGDCVVQTIRHWRMSATLPGRVLRANFNIPPVIAAATATADVSPRRAASSASARRRHR